MPSPTHLTLRKGDTHHLEVIVTREDEDGIDQPVDLAGAQMWFTAKNKTSDDDDEAIIRKGTANVSLTGIDITDAPGGEALITLQPGDTVVGTGTVFLFWDLQLKEADNTITTINGGKLALSEQITISA